MKAYCFANGQIGFGRSEPEGALTFAQGPARKLRAFIEVTSRHGYKKGVLLIPGIPEAPNQKKAMDALIAHQRWLRSHGNRDITI